MIQSAIFNDQKVDLRHSLNTRRKAKLPPKQARKQLDYSMLLPSAFHSVRQTVLQRNACNSYKVNLSKSYLFVFFRSLFRLKNEFLPHISCPLRLYH